MPLLYCQCMTKKLVQKELYMGFTAPPTFAYSRFINVPMELNFAMFKV